MASLLLGIGVVFWSALSWPGGAAGSAIAYALSYAAVWAVSLRLARGQVVNIDAAIGVAAALTLPIQHAVVAAVVGALAGGSADRRNPRETIGVWDAALTRPLPLVAAYMVFRLAGQPDAVTQQLAFVMVALLSGAAYFMLDALVVGRHSRAVWAGLFAAFRPLGTLYLGHLSIGVVLGLLYPWMGLVGLLVLTLLTLVMQNSYSMYLRTRNAYQETIGVLALASELQAPSSAGHAHRVADMAAAVGKLMSLPSRTLEVLNYAALLHEIGRIGTEELEIPGESSQTSLGADIVKSIPFLASARPIIEYHRALDSLPPDASAEARVGSCIVGVCCTYDNMRAQGLGHADTLHALGRVYEDGPARQVVEALSRARLEPRPGAAVEAQAHVTRGGQQ